MCTIKIIPWPCDAECSANSRRGGIRLVCSNRIDSVPGREIREVLMVSRMDLPMWGADRISCEVATEGAAQIQFILNTPTNDQTTLPIILLADDWTIVDTNQYEPLGPTSAQG